MRSRYVYSSTDGHLVAEYRGSDCVFFDAEYYGAIGESALVIPDIEPFQSPDGSFIGGRTQWREHLKRTDSVEMGHSDVKASQVAWAKKREAFQSRLKPAGASEAAPPSGEIKPFQRSGLNVEIANRLHGKPQPARKELIKLSLDLAKRMSRRG